MRVRRTPDPFFGKFSAHSRKKGGKSGKAPENPGMSENKSCFSGFDMVYY